MSRMVVRVRGPVKRELGKLQFQVQLFADRHVIVAGDINQAGTHAKGQSVAEEFSDVSGLQRTNREFALRADLRREFKAPFPVETLVRFALGRETEAAALRIGLEILQREGDRMKLVAVGHAAREIVVGVVDRLCRRGISRPGRCRAARICC